MARPFGRRAISGGFPLLIAAVASSIAFGGEAPLAAQEPAASEPAPVPLENFQNNEDLLFRVGYRLATANAAYCRSPVPVTGLLIHDAYSYGDPEAVRLLFGLTGDIGVQSVAPGSPAARAGLAQNDTILAIDGVPVATGWKKRKEKWKRIFDIRDAIDASVKNGEVELTWSSAGRAPETARLEPVNACPTRFELLDSKNSAAADGERVLVGENFPGFAYDEDAFAAAVAHEMAHNILRHPQTFAVTGWKRSLVRLSERDADRLMPWLLQNAGYDPRAAIRFMETWGPRHGGWIFRKRTHDGWDERVEFIEAELARTEQVIDPNGKADWKSHFVSELEADLEND